jgi:dTDP-4-dehydrorhamnose 3,5-epimerase-like enzyme
MNSKIKGINIIKLKSNIDDRGFFREIIRFDDTYKFDKVINQVSHSHVKKKIFKGWHGHKSQLQINYVVKGKLSVFLYDDRIGSATNDYLEIYDIDSSTPTIYTFEPGILHGYYTSNNEIDIIYLTSSVYDPDQEVRKKFDYKQLNKKLLEKGYEIKF